MRPAGAVCSLSATLCLCVRLSAPHSAFRIPQIGNACVSPFATSRHARTAKDFVKALLTVDPAKRLTADQAMQHKVSRLCPLCPFYPGGRLAVSETFYDSDSFSSGAETEQQWLTDHSGDGKAAHDISVGLRENYRKRWKSAINAVRASTKFKVRAVLWRGAEKLSRLRPDPDVFANSLSPSFSWAHATPR